MTKYMSGQKALMLLSHKTMQVHFEILCNRSRQHNKNLLKLTVTVFMVEKNVLKQC